MNRNFFFREKPLRAILALSDKSRTWYPTLIAKEIDCAYAHLIKLLDQMSESGLVTFERTGRIRTVSITEGGLELAHALEAAVRSADKAGEKKK